MDQETREQYGVAGPEYYFYLNVHGCYKVSEGRNLRK